MGELSEHYHNNCFTKPFQIFFLEFLCTEIILLIRCFCYLLLKGWDIFNLLIVDHKARVLVTQALPELKLQSWLVTDLLTSVSTREKCIGW